MHEWECTGFFTPEIDLDKLKKKEKILVIECPQRIPCDVCREVCPTNAIIMEKISDVPTLNEEKCVLCLKCVENCPGLAIFLLGVEGEKGYMVVPYEFLPIPKEGDEVKVLDRKGKEVGRGIVKEVRMGDTPLVKVEFSPDILKEARGFKT